MEYSLAPMEGITGFVYRRAYHQCFRPMERYVTPFLAPKAGSPLSSRERNDILPEHNPGMRVIPQLLASRAEPFLRAAKELSFYGYREVNLNLGCPSPTVVTKGKGAGMLQDTEKLKRFLEELVTGLSRMGMTLSVKTRLGMERPEEFAALLEIYNAYPLQELIIHPRVREDYYKGTPRLEWFCYGMRHSRSVVCYNGDITSRESLRGLEELCRSDGCPMAERLMLGRGVLARPWLTEELALGEEAAGGKGEDTRRHRLKQFHDLVYQGYQETLSGDRTVLFKMKELWTYLIEPFQEASACLKRIRKSQRMGEYEAAVGEIFRSLALEPERTSKGRKG